MGLKVLLKVNAAKSCFCTHEIEYLGYILTREGIEPQQKKVQAILMLNPPTNVKELRHFLGMVQYYRDMWAKRSGMLAPLSDLVGEWGETKTTRIQCHPNRRPDKQQIMKRLESFEPDQQ